MSSREVIPVDVLMVEDEAGEARVPVYDLKLDCLDESLRLKDDISQKSPDENADWEMQVIPGVELDRQERELIFVLMT